MYCRLCKTTDNLTISNTRTLKSGEIRSSYVCNPCNTARLRLYRATENGAKNARKAVKKYEKNNQKRKKCWEAVAKIKSNPCEVCGEVKVHKHHPDIEKPLFIKFLCPKHHKAAHLAMS